MNIKLGFPEALLAFSALASSTNFTLCIVTLSLAVAGAIVRMCMEFNEKQEEKRTISDGAKILTETLQSVITPKNDRSLH